ncbi:BnaC05g26450D [Brassica napus]|uniref:BnaC05g26450D protein n=1 Tax=Brassica napus TaxID=3708 RepID=A0A078G763_BRANA|nr:BnaC05g26450D [Brassica napus]
MSEHVCFVYSSESVNGTNAGRKSLPEDKGPDVPADASSSKDKSPEPSLEDARYLEKRDAALALCRAKSDRTRKLAASQQSPYTTNSTAKMIIPNKNLYPGYNPFPPIDKKKLKELADWLKTCPHYRIPLDKKPRTSRTWWYQILRTSLEWLEDYLNEDIRRLTVNYNDTHWIAMWISIPKRHIVVWDSICSSISPEDLDVRPTNIHPARVGDCGVYTLKYIECHALGIEFSKKNLC